MYVYMRNYMKILKDDLSKCKKKKKKSKVNLRTLFVEILSSKRAIERVASINPTKT